MLDLESKYNGLFGTTAEPEGPPKALEPDDKHSNAVSRVRKKLLRRRPR